MVLPRWAFWLALGGMTIGLLGVFLPLIPGVGFIWLIALIYAIAEKFAAIDPITFTVLTILGAIGVSSDIWMSKLGAKVGGASAPALLAGLGLGVVGALLGLIIGTIGLLFGLPFLEIGIAPLAIIGAMLGVFLVEWRKHDDPQKALKATGGWLIGCFLSGIVQFAISALMMLIFIWQVLRGA